MRKPSHNCDATARAGMWVIFFMGSMGLVSLFGLLWLVGGAKVTAEVAVIAVLGGAVQASMTGLPSLMARMSGQAEHAQDVNVTNPPENPVHVTEEKP